jgi:hypothetical protein
MISTTVKRVTIVSTRPRKEVVVEVSPQDTASDVLEKAGLAPDDLLMQPGDQADFEPTSLPFDAVPDGGKLHALKQSSVGLSA